MPQGVLKEIFGFDSFRPGQEAVIRAVLEGRDTLAVMPTGGGKSLCYQIPALMQRSLTVIVSPLISLMKDQVDSLLQSSVADAAALHSGLSPEERWEVERKVRTGEIRMLYVAPERLRSLEFVLSLRRAGVGLFVVDEAHCISEWGHDFRPDYLFLPRAVKDLGSPPVLALTATATPRVRDDILRSLKMRDPEVVVTSFNRPNLTYRVLSAKEKKHKLPLILDVIRKSPPPGIVYVATRRGAEELAAALCDEGLRAASYHAGMRKAEREAAQERAEEWDRSRVDMVRGYAETTGCRRAFVLSYFGEPFEAPCGNCDNCLAGRSEPAPSDVPFAVGARVAHGEWGEGVVQRYDEDAVVILFDEAGYRTLALDVVVERSLLRAA